jgi:hypothetical protein
MHTIGWLLGDIKIESPSDFLANRVVKIAKKNGAPKRPDRVTLLAYNSIVLLQSVSPGMLP